jgi:phage tail-like protein
MPVAERIEPIAGFRFGIEIEGVIQGWFTECSGLTIERKTEQRREGGVNDFVHQLPGRIEYTSISLKRGIADNALWDWFQKGLYDGKVERHNISIILYSQDYTKAKRWNLRDAYPTKWTGPSLRTDSNEAVVETLELVHHGMEMTDWTAV